MPKYTPKILCRIAAFAALYVVLTTLTIRAGNLRITFASLPVVVSALLFGPGESALVALLGGFLNQMLTHGFTATTVLWLIPPVVRGLIIGAVARRSLKNGRGLEERPGAYYATCMGAALATTVCNTAVIYLDSVIYHYYTFAYVFGDALLRTLSALVTAAGVATIALPLTRLLRRQVVAQK